VADVQRAETSARFGWERVTEDVSCTRLQKKIIEPLL
jgi:hypothetical protein